MLSSLIVKAIEGDEGSKNAEVLSLIIGEIE
jgi:hypothetical protein